MYKPIYTINSNILNSIAQIEAAKAIITQAPLVPAFEKQFRQDAIIRAVHYATKLEGNDLSYQEVAKVIEGEKIIGQERDVQEVINYRNVVEYLEELLTRYKENLPLPGEKTTPTSTQRQEGTPFLYTENILKRVQELAVEKIIKPDQAGKYRKVQVVLANSQTGETVFKPPISVEVPMLIENFLEWLNSPEGRDTHPIIRSAITHYALVAIHPFVEGNGRTARAIATLILMVEGYNIKGLFALEEYFDRNADQYYGALQKVSSQPGSLSEKDLTIWIEFFSKALSIELNRIKEKVQNLSSDIRLKQKLGGQQIPLTERQVKLVEYIREFGGLRMADAKELFPMVSEDTIWRDLKKLSDQKIVEKKGSTKGAYYTLSS